MAKFTENGFEIDGLVQIRERLTNSANAKFEPLLSGQTLSTDDSSVIGRQLGILSESLALQEEALQVIVTSFDPQQAAGSVLDDLVYLTLGDYRLDSDPAFGLLIVFGTVGSVIYEGASARSRVTGDVFNLDNPVIFNTTACNGVEFDVVLSSVESVYRLTYGVEGKPSENPPIELLSLPTDTKETLAARIAQTINSQTSDLVATVTNSNKVNVYIRNRMNVGFFNTTANLPIESSYIPVYSTSATYTAVSQDADTVSQINSGANSGWLSVTNPYATAESTPVESDTDLRYRWRLSKASNAFGDYDAMLSSLLRVRGVKFVNIQQNITSQPNGERINQGVSVVVQGGNGQAVANEVFRNLPIGTATNGTEEYFVSDITGTNHSVKLSRPNLIPIKISMSVKALPNFPTNGKNMIKQAIVDYFNSLDVGEDILYSRLFEPINTIQGFSANNLRIGKLSGNLGVDDIVLKFNELATIRPEDILIGGS